MNRSLISVPAIGSLVAAASIAFGAGSPEVAAKPVTRGKPPVTTVRPKPKMDPLEQPFTVDGRGLLRAPFLPAGWKADATFSGSVHSPLEFGNFFRRPEFKTKEHDGRLYFTNYLNREGKGNVAFVTWRPLNAKADKAQHIRPLPGYTVEDFQTDGKVLEVRHYPEWPKKIPIKVQIYRWEGDQAGNGRFILLKTKDGEPAAW
jgi:hypothetical protein